MDINQYLGKEIKCECGKIHSCLLKDVEIGKGAMEKIPAFLKKEGSRSIYIVADINTNQVAGEALTKLLDQAALPYSIHVLKAEEVVPDEQTLGEIVMNMPSDTDMIIAVGSGTINDLCKFVSDMKSIDYIVVATAPSMDGFASKGAALIANHLKTTYPTKETIGIFADTDILKEAPMNMITAGFGDIIGKYTCLTDWKIAHIVNDEYHCTYVEDMVKEAIKQVVDTADQIKNRDENAVARIMEALVLTGIAMSFVGNSRPASGSEHHMSHYWEMKFLMADKEMILHGTKVGIGTVASSYLYHQLIKENMDFDKAKASAAAFDKMHWTEEIKRCFELAADGVIALEEETKKNDVISQGKRIKVIEERWSDIVKAVEEWLPNEERIKEILLTVGAPVNPHEVGVPDEMIEDCILYAKEVRNRYTILQLLWDTGLLTEYAKKGKDYFM